MALKEKLKAAIEAGLQNITDNDGEIETQAGDFRSKAGSPDQIAKLIESAQAAGISLNDSPTKRTLSTRIG